MGVFDQDETLVCRCIEGDSRAWESLVAQYSGLVYSIARAFGLREDQCDDVAQSVFLSLTRGLSSLKEPKALRGWISTTTRREASRVRRSALKRAASTLEVDPVGRERAVNEAADEAERIFVLRNALHELGERCRKLLEALYVERQAPDYQTISERLGMPVGSIGPTRIRCLAKLAELLREASPGIDAAG